MNNVMVDLETLGTRPGCSILSIGAVAFDKDGLGETFYTVIRRDDCSICGLTEDPSTIDWWDKQSPEARKVLAEAESTDAPGLASALILFNQFLQQNGGGRNTLLWGNGADFDNTILTAAYRAAGVPLGWGLYGNRCYRTVKSLRKDLKIQRGGSVHHNALDDAVAQANHLIAIINGAPPALSRLLG